MSNMQKQIHQNKSLNFKANTSLNTCKQGPIPPTLWDALFLWEPGTEREAILSPYSKARGAAASGSPVKSKLARNTKASCQEETRNCNGTSESKILSRHQVLLQSTRAGCLFQHAPRTPLRRARGKGLVKGQGKVSAWEPTALWRTAGSVLKGKPRLPSRHFSSKLTRHFFSWATLSLVVSQQINYFSSIIFPRHTYILLLHFIWYFKKWEIFPSQYNYFSFIKNLLSLLRSNTADQISTSRNYMLFPQTYNKGLSSTGTTPHYQSQVALEFVLFF